MQYKEGVICDFVESACGNGEGTTEEKTACDQLQLLMKTRKKTRKKKEQEKENCCG